MMNPLKQFRRLLAVMVCLVFSTSAYSQDTSDWIWNDPKPVTIPGVTHHTIESSSMQRTVGFNVYLPPQYAAEPKQRFPVVYFLHGSGGTETSDAGLAYQVAAEIKAERIEPCIYVFPNGGKRSGYRDWNDQNVKSETLVMKELLPHIDANFRTINDGRKRGICGFSMGGGGALRLALKYPGQFCAAASLAAAFDKDAKGHNGDNVHFHAKKNQKAIRKSLALSFVVGSEDFLLRRHPAFLSLLKELKIEHTYRQLDDVGHNLGLYTKHSSANMVRFIAQRIDSQEKSVSDFGMTQQQGKKLHASSEDKQGDAAPKMKLVPLSENKENSVVTINAKGDFVEFNVPSNVSVDQVIAITGVQLIDGRGGEPIADATLIIRGSKIEAVGSADSIQIPGDATVVDLSGMTVVPGFVDCHFHSINDRDLPRKFLNNGVTTFRDPGHPFRFYQAVKQASTPMPRVFLTGAHIDAYPPIWPQQAKLVANKEQARQAVADHVRHGATAIKTYFRLPLPLLQAVCETANSQNIPVTAHLELVSSSDAIAAGLSGVEHVTSFGTSLADKTSRKRFEEIVSANPKLRKEWRYRLWSEIDLETSTKLNTVLEQLINKKVVLSPTLAVFERRREFEGVKDYEVMGFHRMLEFVRRCHQAGAIIVAGSHTWVPGAELGFAFQRELELLVECGMTPLEAITAGTLNGAQFLRSENRLGSIEPGKLADLIVVTGNPVEDITSLRNVRRVMLNGRWIEKE